MRRTLSWFILKLVIASAVLYVAWEWKGETTYAVLFGRVALPIYRILGIDLATMRLPLRIIVDRFYNILPFLTLMAAMWGVSWKRRLIGTLAGVAIIIAWHVAFALIVRAIVSAHQLDPTAYRQLSPWFLFSDALPFVLWVVIAHRPLTQSMIGAKRAAQGAEAPCLKS